MSDRPSGSGPSVTPHENETTPRVVVTTNRRGIIPRRLFKQPWRALVRREVLQLANLQLWRNALIEGIFTGLWVFASILSICNSVLWGDSLPGRTILVIAFLHFLMFTLYISALVGKEAGSPQLNPALTFVLMLTGLRGPTAGMINIVGQCLGGILASLCAKELISKERREAFLLGGCYARRTVLVGNTPIVVGFSDHQAFLAEFVFTFSFLYVTVLISEPKQMRNIGLKLAPFLISANVAFNIYLSATLRTGYGGSMMNPARCLGPAVAYGQPLWDRLWAPFLAPFVASFSVALLCILVPGDHLEVYATKQDVFSRIRRSMANEEDSQNEENTVYEVPPGKLYNASPNTPDIERQLSI